MLSAVKRPVATRSTALCAMETMTSPCVRTRGAYERQKQPKPATRTLQATALPGGAGLPCNAGFQHHMVAVPPLPRSSLLQLVESSPHIVVAVARKGLVIFDDAGAPRTLGPSPEGVLGQDRSRLYPDLEEARKV